MPENSPTYRDIMSGTARGAWPAGVRCGLRVASWAYGLAVRSRNFAYDRGWTATHRADVPVISLGNLTAGGTGKTPMAAWFARWFRDRGVRVGLLSRGYGSVDGAPNDEALVLEQLCPDVPHLQGADRVALAKVACEELDMQLLLLDDGFQHRRLARDLDVVLIDALDPWGYSALLPRGLLREPLASLGRAGLAIMTRVDQVEPRELVDIRQRIARMRSDLPICETAFPPSGLLNASGISASFESLAGRSVAAFCGLGNPSAFRRTVEQAGLKIHEFRTFPDHHAYSRDDVESLSSWASTLPVEAVVTSQKDLVKLQMDHLGSRPLWAVQIGVRIVAGQVALEQALNRVLAAVAPG